MNIFYLFASLVPLRFVCFVTVLSHHIFRSSFLSFSFSFPILTLQSKRAQANESHLLANIKEQTIPTSHQSTCKQKWIMSLSTVGSSFARRGYPILHSLKRLHQPTQIMSPHVRHYSLEIQPAFPLFRIDQSLPSLWNEFTLLIKRTFQPSVIRKRRKTGFLKRHKSVGGRRVLDRRAQKGRIRLGGC